MLSQNNILIVKFINGVFSFVITSLLLHFLRCFSQQEIPAKMQNVIPQHCPCNWRQLPSPPLSHYTVAEARIRGDDDDAAVFWVYNCQVSGKRSSLVVAARCFVIDGAGCVTGNKWTGSGLPFWGHTMRYCS